MTDSHSFGGHLLVKRKDFSLLLALSKKMCYDKEQLNFQTESVI